jgi:hypothetical protein
MRTVLLVVALIPVVPLAQIANYVGKNAAIASCASTFVVAPTITAEMLGGDFEPDELTNASNSLASAVASHLKGSEILQPGDISKIEDCTSKVVVVRLKSYHTEPARMGQHRGYIVVQLLYFDSPKSQTPTETKEFEDSGAVHWGESTPFANAVKSVAKTIRHGL